MPGGFILPPGIAPYLANSRILNTTSPLLVPPSHSLTSATTPSQQDIAPLESQSSATPAGTEADKEEGELSDSALPTGPASMQGKRKRALQSSRERNQQGVRITKKQVKRDERRVATLNRIGRGKYSSMYWRQS